MRKAVIDLGTNTFNLLIADVSEHTFEMVYSTKEAVLLGMGGINHNKIAADAMARAMHTIRYFINVCDSLEVKHANIKAIGTSALRGAENANEFVEKVIAIANIEVQIISGEQEATYIFQGVNWTYDFETPGVIMDIGGGSTEFIYADKRGIQSMVSLNIGVSRVYQLFQHPEVYDISLQKQVYSYFDDSAGGKMNNFTSDVLIGASGSFETFYEMIFQLEWNPNQGLVELPYDELKKQLEWAINSTQAERDAHNCIISIRKTMLPIAAMQILWAIEKTACSRVLLSSYSLKEGALHS